MFKRMYYVLPDVSHATHMFHDLLLAQVEARHIHVIAKEGTDLGDMPEAGLNQRTDVVHGAAQGIFYGGLTGAALGLYLYQFNKCNSNMQFPDTVFLIFLTYSTLLGLSHSYDDVSHLRHYANPL